MKLAHVLVAVVLLGATLGHAQDLVECEAFAALKIRVSRGRCSGQASASCTAISDSQSAIQEAVDGVFLDGGECEVDSVEAAATAIADAIASVYVEALAQVECDGRGFACGFSLASGDAQAVAFAQAIAIAAADAGGDNANAFCVADIEAVSGAIANAAADAQAAACVQDVGSVEDFSSAFVEQTATAIASAFATATAAACDPDGNAAANSLCAGEAVSDFDESQEIETEGDGASAEGDAEQLDACVGAGECCDPGFTANVCTGCPGCDRPWFKLTEAADDGTQRSWRIGRDVCFCFPDDK